MNEIPADKTHSKTIGYLLWIFGFTGAHRFYYGRKVTGLVWFLTLGLLGVGWLIDLFLIPRMDREADERYTPGPVDYSIAWLLHTYLGIFGIHRFYMGKWVTGFIYLFTGGVFLIGHVIDFWTLNDQVDESNRLTLGLPPRDGGVTAKKTPPSRFSDEIPPSA